MSRTVVLQVIVALLILTGLLGGFGGKKGPAPRAESGEVEPKKLTKIYFGADACRNCHGKDKEEEPDKALFYRGTEMSTWKEDDKHKQATNVLLGERGRQMAKILGYKKDITTEPKCISCHGVHVEKVEEIDEDSYGKPKQRVDNGVSCVACHGAFEEWVNNHAGKIVGKKGMRWKDLSPEQKESQHGLRNLWDPVKRAELCCSCHIGNADQGKVVTHEMYAAGHPPLPGIEIVAFGEAMPRHWRTFSEKIAADEKAATPADFRQRFKKYQDFDADRDGLEQARMLMISSVAAFRESMRLVAGLAKSGEADGKNEKLNGAQEDADTRSWPELASFDCYACHHDLKKDAWRQKRGYTGKPGRPALRPWPETLVPFAVQHVELSKGSKENTDFQRSLKELRGVFDAQPFGEPAKVALAAGKMEKWADSLIDQLKKAPFDRATCSKSLLALPNIPMKRALDFDSARQVAWAFRTLLTDLEPDQVNRQEWKASLDALETYMKLDLLKGKKEIVPDFLHETLTRISNFDPDQFTRLMEVLSAKYRKPAK